MALGSNVGTSRSVVELLDKTRRAAAAIRDIEPKAVGNAAELATDILNRSIRRAAPSGRLTPRKVVVAAVRKQRPRDAVALVTPRGPIGLIEGPIEPHLVGAGRKRAKGGRETRANYRRTVFLKGGGYGHPVRGPIAHPGTKGKRPWRDARPEVDRRVVPRMANPIVKGVSEVFR